MTEREENIWWIVLAVILLIILTLIFSPVKIFVNYQNGKQVLL